MATTPINQLTKDYQSRIWEEAHDEEEKLTQECKELVQSLPRERGWATATPYLYLFQDFWCSPSIIQNISSFQKHFQAKENDIIVITQPKSGTTWLKSLTFAIVNRKRFTPSQKSHPLLTSNSHELVPFLDVTVYQNNQVPDLSNLPEPRLFSTHLPFASLPSSIKKSNCRIIYMCRNPFDTFVSYWHFSNKITAPSLPKFTLDEAFEMYCKGISWYGPFWTQMLGYWKESKDTPNKVLFLKYEDLKGDTNFHLKRVAEFLNCPFTLEEESKGVTQDIIELCSFEKMKEFEVNKTGKSIREVENKNFFRKGEIGDWVNYFSPSMVEKLSKLIEEKLGGSDLSFGTFS